MYFEIIKNRTIIARGNDILGPIGWDSEFMAVPRCDITLPIKYFTLISGREEIRIYTNDKCFYGIIMGIRVDKDAETIKLSIDHVVHEWTYRQLSVNNAIKDGKVNIVYQEEREKVVEKTTTETSTSSGSAIAPSKDTSRFSGSLIVNEPERKPEPSEDIKAEYTYLAKQIEAHRKWQLHERNIEKVEEKTEEEIEKEVVDIEPQVVDSLVNIYRDLNFAYPGWYLDMSEKAQKTDIDYVYSRQDKLEGLTKTMELTPDLYWLVGFTDEKVMHIGEFGEKVEYIFSQKPTGKNNIRIIGEPEIIYDFANVFNMASVYSEKSDSGMSSLTLREIYNDPSLQDEMFPVVILTTNVNNERNYEKYTDQYPSLAPNNELEYAVIDVESVALEGGELIETTAAFNDLAPFNVVEAEDEETETVEVTDADRIKVAQIAYDATKRLLRENRRSLQIKIKTEQLPSDIMVGHRIRLLYDNNLIIRGACSNYQRKILSLDDWYYITKIEYDIDEYGVEVDTVTLEKELRVSRDLPREEIEIGRIIELEVEKVAETAVETKKEVEQDKKQRRNQVVDLYGVEYTRDADGGAPAKFYISISPDMVYMERFEFKLIIQPFTSTTAGGTQSAEVKVKDTSLSVSGSSITPNPHKHDTEPHTHNVIGGISLINTTASDFRVYIEGVDVTEYLMAQYDAWIDGEGVYPSLDIERDYDILEVISDLRMEGRMDDAKKLEQAGYKSVQISSQSPFRVTLVNYLKYSHLNR